MLLQQLASKMTHNGALQINDAIRNKKPRCLRDKPCNKCNERFCRGK